MLRIGGLGMLGGLNMSALSLPGLLRGAQAAPLTVGSGAMFGRAKNIIFLYLTGGPPQHETFDPKPDAPADIRGPFGPISTNVPGVQFCELLPRTARIADKLAVVRSMATDDNIHSSSGAWVLTGYKYVGSNARTIQQTDWPWFGSLIKRYRPSDDLPALSAVWIPVKNRLNESVTPAGQTGGLMGSRWNPELFTGDPAAERYKVEGFDPRGITPMRLDGRRRLLDQVSTHFDSVGATASVENFDAFQQQAFDLMTSGKARQAFAIGEEPDAVRDRYGRNRWGQTVLLARRLIEVGVRLVHVQWPREPGDNAADNPMWDTHAQNHDRVEDVLCPTFDVGFTALIEDLDERGLLDETLVVAIGEFGRTPKINPKSGRDHWGSVFSFALAGAGISGGQVYGSSDKHGAFPKTDRVQPGDLTATMFHLVGLDYQGTFSDHLGRELALTKGEPIWQLLGERPATDQRVEPGGDVARVPPFDPDAMLANTDFTGGANTADVLKPADTPSRPKGWRVETTGAELFAGGGRFGAWLASEGRQIARPHAAVGINVAADAAPVVSDAPLSVFLGQEVRSPFAGTFRFMVRACGDASSREFFEQIFGNQFTCRLLFFEFAETAKKITDRKELVSMTFTPGLSDPAAPVLEEFTLSRRFANDTPGGNFSFGLGLGVGISIERTADAPLELTASHAPQHATLRIESVRLEHLGKELDPDVVV